MLQQLFLAAHVLVALLIIVFVLLQRGKGAETGAAFGSGASGTVFGARGSANFLSRLTAVLATLFFATSLILTGAGRPKPEQSLLETLPQSAPAGDEEAAPIDPAGEGLPQLPPDDQPAPVDPAGEDLPQLPPDDDPAPPDLDDPAPRSPDDPAPQAD